MKRDYITINKSVIIGCFVGFLVGLIAHYFILPYLILFGFFGNWLDSTDENSLIYFMYSHPWIDSPIIITIIFIILGALIGHLVKK